MSDTDHITESTFSIAGATALLTGASSGIGPAIATELDRAGARVALQYHHNESGATALAKQLANQHVTLQADLSIEAEVRSLFAETVNQLGPISILINCAAAESQNVESLTNIAIEKWSATMRTNVDAPLILTQMFAGQGNPGAIVNISSIEASRPAIGHSHYSTSKAALEMLTKSSALEYGEKGIRVNAIAPGLIWREGIEEGWPEGVNAWQDASPLGKLVRPEDIANAVLFLASERAASITGTVLTIDAGMSIKPGW